MTRKINTVLPVLSILGAVFLWGSSFSAMRHLLGNLTPMEVMFFRHFFAFMVIVSLCGKIRKHTRKKPYQKGDWKTLIPMVLFQPCLYFLFESNALMFTTSAQAGIISACLPLMVAVAAWFFLAERLGKLTLTGLVLSVMGVVILTGFQSDHAQAPNPVLGNLLELMAMLSACGYMILVKKLTMRYPPLLLTAMQVFTGVFFFSPGLVTAYGQAFADWSIQTWLILIYLGTCVTFLSFALYNFGISKISASKASIFINLIPVTAVFLGWLFLSETLNLIQITASGMIILGVIISNKD